MCRWEDGLLWDSLFYSVGILFLADGIREKFFSGNFRSHETGHDEARKESRQHTFLFSLLYFFLLHLSHPSCSEYNGTQLFQYLPLFCNVTCVAATGIELNFFFTPKGNVVA